MISESTQVHPSSGPTSPRLEPGSGRRFDITEASDASDASPAQESGLAVDRALVTLWVHGVRRAIAVGAAVLVTLLAYPWLPGHGTVERWPYLAAVATGGVFTAAAAAIPWGRMLNRRAAEWLIAAWAAVMILVSGAMIAATGGPSSMLFLLDGGPVIFVVAWCPPRTQAPLLALAVATYVADVRLFVGGVDLAPTFVRLVLLAGLALLARILASHLRSQLVGQALARVQSEHRTALLRSLATSARSISTLEPNAVLLQVARAATELGFSSACVHLLDSPDVSASSGYCAGGDDLLGPIMARGGSHEETVQRALSSFQQGALITELSVSTSRETLLGAAIHEDGRLAGVLVVSSVSTAPADQTEALTSLALLAGIALDNARRFASERETADRLARLDALERDFLANVSHELRTPLAVIEGIGSTLHHRWRELPDEVRIDLLERLTANTASLDRTIADLLDLDRLEAGQLPARPESLHPALIARAVLARVETLFAPDSVELRLDPEVRAFVDPHLLERVCENLLSNAGKFTAPGTPVRLIVRGTPTEAFLEVEDDGPGIPPAELAHIGERFFRGGPTTTRSTRGTGIGLAFVREVATLHGGRLEVASTLGVGSRFTVRIPRVPPPSLKPAHAAKLPADMSPAQPERARLRHADPESGSPLDA